MRLARTKAWIAGATLALGSVGHAQNAAPPPPAAPPPTPVEAWAKVRQAYAGAPTADRVTVSVLGADGSTRGAESFEIRIDPRPGNEGGPRVRLDLGLIRLVAGDARLTGVHVLSREGAFVADLPGTLTPAALRSLIPPLPLPALGVLTEGDAPPDAMGYLRPAEWTDAVREATTGGLSIIGRVSGARARVTTAPSGRLRELALTELPGGGSITASFVQLAAPVASDFELDVEAWNRVGSLRELFRLPPTPVEPGQPVPELAVQGPQGDPLLLNEALAKVTPARIARPDAAAHVEQDPPRAERIVLVLHRLPADPAACERPDPGLVEARAALAELLFKSERDRFLGRAAATGADPAPRLPALSGAIVLVADLGEGNAPLRLERASKGLDAVALAARHADFKPRVFEAASAVGIIGPFALNVGAGETLVVTLTGDWRLIRAEPWTPGLTPAQGVARIEQRLHAP